MLAILFDLPGSSLPLYKISLHSLYPERSRERLLRYQGARSASTAGHQLHAHRSKGTWFFLLSAYQLGVGARNIPANSRIDEIFLKIRDAKVDWGCGVNDVVEASLLLLEDFVEGAVYGNISDEYKLDFIFPCWVLV